jgi:hypothetical protein
MPVFFAIRQFTVVFEPPNENPGVMPGSSSRKSKRCCYCCGADGAGRFVLGASVFMLVDGAGGALRWPVVAGGTFESRATRSASRPLLKAKINTNATSAMPAIHPQVAPDQEPPESAARSGSRYPGRIGSR